MPVKKADLHGKHYLLCRKNITFAIEEFYGKIRSYIYLRTLQNRSDIQLSAVYIALT